jgi:hypothetical protein
MDRPMTRAHGVARLSVSPRLARALAVTRMGPGYARRLAQELKPARSIAAIEAQAHIVAIEAQADLATAHPGHSDYARGCPLCIALWGER